MVRIITPLALLLVLGACATTAKVSITSASPICTALVGPIKYNTYVKSSSRYAGAALAVDLKQRNQVGVNLRCPAYHY